MRDGYLSQLTGGAASGHLARHQRRPNQSINQPINLQLSSNQRRPTCGMRVSSLVDTTTVRDRLGSTCAGRGAEGRQQIGQCIATHHYSVRQTEANLHSLSQAGGEAEGRQLGARLVLAT